MAWTSLCNLDELEEGRGKYVEIDGFQLAVFLDGGAVSVIDNTCPHAGGNLAAGYVEEGCAVCPWHYWAFRLDTGEMRESPGVSITKYRVRVLEHQGKQLVQAELPTY
jgi:nitrite reductase/ring-hydroxylating ferredoxin subunit